MHPHAHKWTNPSRLLAFLDALDRLQRVDFPDLSPADVSFCLQLMHHSTMHQFMNEAVKRSLETPDASQHVN